MRTQLAPTAGSMGYGVPAAIAAKIAAPERCVVCFAGDGDFQMTGQELGTAIQYGAGVLFLVFNNGMFGTIRMHQEREYPQHESGSALHNPNFVALAQAYGYAATRITHTEQFEPALVQALAADRGTLIEVVLSPEVITTRGTLSASSVITDAAGEASFTITSPTAGQTELMFDNLASAAANIRAGKLRAFAVTTAARAPSFPELPTMAEAGGKDLAGFDVTTWFGVMAPAGTPAPVVARLNDEFRKALASADMRERLVRMGAEPAPNSPAEFAAFIRSELAKYEKVVKFSGAKVD
jgi:hypothetical protein